ncbi:MAG TPA: hypothetical protein VNR87_12590 [Flavisolibacter sp.]|nr:hypothetical protein [Flavisolibacter sp.]
MRRKAVLFFLFLSLLNLVIVFLRDAFQYQPFSSPAALYAPCDEKCSKKWNQYVNDFPREELAAARNISDSVVAGKAPTEDKVMAIGLFIYNRFKGQMGRPSAELLRSSPFRQYQQLAASDSVKLWCGNFAEIFSWFCWSHGIVCRNIEVMNPGNHHVLNECYIPESGRWVLVDLTNNLLMAQSKEQRLNLYEMMKALKARTVVSGLHASGDSVSVELLDPATSYIQNFYQADHPYFYYHRVDNEKVYRTGSKLVRYFLPLSWYEILELKKQSNLPFYLKEVFSLLWLISLIMLLVSRKKLRYD